MLSKLTKSLLTFTLLIFAGFVYAQNPLTPSRQSSYYTYIYKLNAADVVKFYETDSVAQNSKSLITAVDSFKTYSYWKNNLPPGNYLKVYAEKNRFHYSLIQNRSAFLQVLRNNYDTRFIITDANGTKIQGAGVSIKNKAVPFDEKSGSYHPKIKDAALVEVNYNGIPNYYRLKNNRKINGFLSAAWFKRNWHNITRPFRKKPDNNYDDDYKYKQRLEQNDKYTGFMVFNKPMFKPHDTVKFKAFIIDRKSRKPITDHYLIARIQDGPDDDGKILGTVNSYRDGGFDYQFILTDSLDLRLNDDYFISLEAASAVKYNLDKYDGDDDDEKYLSHRKVYIAAQFSYEDYELKGINFTTRTDKKEHENGTPLSLYLKATDENELPVQDGRFEIRLRSYNIEKYNAARVFIPDTLWTYKGTLEPVGETKVMIPDSIFPKANFHYTIYTELLTTDNERHSASNYVDFKYENYRIKPTLNGDTLKLEGFYKGKPASFPVLLSGINRYDDTITRQHINLPAHIMINPALKTYAAKADSTVEVINMTSYSANLSFSGYQTADSVFIKANNPHNLHFWYWLIGNKNNLVDAGEADKLVYKKRWTDKSPLIFTASYMWGGETQLTGIKVPYQEKLLTINVKQPIAVYPGQQVKTEIEVKDAAGKPVPNTDITAWSLTSKFPNYEPPFVPYLGKSYPAARIKPWASLANPTFINQTQLNWPKWSRQMGLDSISYYLFTHPKTTYRVSEPVPDSVTQIAPFVVKNGDIIPVHILYIDERPVYFSQAQQLQRYSFKTTPGMHHIRFRTGNQDITIDTVTIPKGRKLILSVNADTLNKAMRFKTMPDTLVQYEADLLNMYMIRLVNNFGINMATIEQGNNILLLNPNASSTPGEVLTGPLTENYATFKLRGDEPRQFLTESGYSYQFEPGLIKQKSIKTRYPFNKYLRNGSTADDYTQYALTAKETELMWQHYLDLRSRTTPLFRNEPIDDAVTGKLKIQITDTKGEEPFVKNTIIYRDGFPDFIRIYTGNETNLGNLGVGKYRLFFLLKDDKYYIKDNVTIRPNGINFYRVDITEHPKDSVSIKINKVITGRTGINDYNDHHIENDALKLKEAFNEKYLDKASFTNTIRGQVLAGDDNKPLPAVSVTIKGTNISTFTDANGRFTIAIPQNGKLLFRFVGYEQQESTVNSERDALIVLLPLKQQLQEVVVVGYGTQRRASVTGSISRVTTATYGASDTFNIRGVAGVGAAKPLVVVDGIIVENADSIDPNLIGDISILKDTAATAIYGSRGANGVIVISTKNKLAALNTTNNSTATVAQASLRKNFSDYAYWQPHLTTDENGKTSFTATFPDDITNWRTFVIGINGNRQAGFADNQIKSFKPLSANFIAPQFAIAGDEMNLIGKVMNYNSTPAKLTRTFKYNGQQLKQDEFEVKNSKIDTLKITASTLPAAASAATNTTDSLTFEYTIKRDNGYFDGEERKIPVMPQGTKETKGLFEALDRDTTVTLKFDPALGPVTFHAEASALPVLAEETRKLREYKYLCNEQLASKLKGLIMERRIKKFLGEDFKYGKNIQEVIKKLKESRKVNGLWGWWKDSQEELWISLHAVEALLEAQQEGFAVELDKRKLTDYLIYQMESYRGQDKIMSLQLLHKLGAKADYQQYINIIEKEQAKAKRNPDYVLSGYDKLRTMLLRQQAGLKTNIDSLLATAKHTMFGNMYWGEAGYRFFDNSIQLSVLAYRIIKSDGHHPEVLNKIRGYFLEQRRPDDWRNTYESALILETILPDMLIENKQVKPSQITIAGAETKTITQFPYSATLTDKQISVRKTGGLPIYITGYQQFWNSKPEKVSKDFTVNTRFERNAKTITTLKGGEIVQLKAEITARGDADFVMVEIPIPAGCSYEGKEQSWSSNEVHREYFKEKVSIFCRKLKQGKYTFTVNLIPRYDGKYTLNPAKAEMMYFPVFYGREGMKKIVIGE